MWLLLGEGGIHLEMHCIVNVQCTVVPLLVGRQFVPFS